MALIEYSANVSLDGFIEDSDGSLEWSDPSEEVHRYWNDLTEESAGTIMGRRLYETMIPFWSDWLADPQGPDYVDHFARAWMAKPRLVASRSLDSVDGGCELIDGEAAPRVAALRSEESGTWSVGGAELAGSLHQDGLIDRIRLVVVPALVRVGKPFFAEGFGPMKLSLVDSKTFGCGSQMLLYELG
jgi:dihydrofolate reductase